MIGRYVVIAGFLLTAPGALGGQVIRGKVKQAGTENAIASAQVELAVPGRQTVRATTDSAGVFVLAIPRGGRYSLTVSHLSYATLITDSVDVGGGENLSLEIRLGTSPIAMAPLVVTSNSRARASGFYDRMRSQPGGRFLTRADMDARGSSRMSDLLRTMPGVTIARVPRSGRRGSPLVNMIVMRGAAVGQCEPAIFLDGSPIRQTTDSTLDDFILPDQLEGIEVYAANSGGPPQYLTPGKCGVLLLWSRVGQNDGGKPLTLKRALITAGVILGVVVLIR